MDNNKWPVFYRTREELLSILDEELVNRLLAVNGWVEQIRWDYEFRAPLTGEKVCVSGNFYPFSSVTGLQMPSAEDMLDSFLILRERMMEGGE